MGEASTRLVSFLRKLERGGSEHSFGIHVAKMAGMPQSIVRRADEILHRLEQENRQDGIASKPKVQAASKSQDGVQLSFFQLDDPVLCQIRDEILHLDVNNLTPIERRRSRCVSLRKDFVYVYALVGR